MARKSKREVEQAGFTDQQGDQTPRLTPVDIQQKVFRLAFRGYSERDVDEFLDQVTEELAGLHEENKRLREQLQEGSGSPGAVAAAQRQAEAIVRQAREHAARLTEEAERRGGAAGPMVSASFLVREREFLRQLAAMVQGHARALKDEARRVRETGGPPAPALPAAVGGFGPEDTSRAWGPADDEQPAAEAWPDEAATAEPDPLLSAWESAFAERPEGGMSGEGLPGDESRERQRRGEEPSLKELFWGEE